MLTACWSVKGGSGTTAVAAALTVSLVGGGRTVVAADFAGDLAVALGLPDPTGPGVRNWLDAGSDVPADGLERIAAAGVHGITLVPRGEWTTGRGGSDAEATLRLAEGLRALAPGAPVVADCGVVDSPAMHAFVAAADRSLLVVRGCYLGLRRAVAAPRPTAVIVVEEPGRSLSARDVGDQLGVPVAAVVEWDPKVAYALDTGLLRTRLPRRVAQTMRRVAA